MPSAICWGEPVGVRSSAKPVRMPSVAKIRVSLGDNGTIQARARGSSAPTMPPKVTRVVREGCSDWSASSRTPSTLPTPSHVIVACSVSNDAKLTTAPRNPRSASWQRRSRSATGSLGTRSSAVMACRAVVAASPPCPSASTTAASTPPANGWTRAKSPDAVSPGWARSATAQSSTPVTGARPVRLAMRAFSLLHGDRGALARRRDDIELVHQAARAREPESQAARCRKAVLHRPRDVGNARPLIARDDDDAAAIAVEHDAERDRAAARVIEDVARDFRDRGRNHRLVAGAEADLLGQLAAALPRTHHV